MQTATIVPLPSRSAPAVDVERDRIVIAGLTVVDGPLAAFVAGRPEEDRPGLLERAVRIGLTALQDAGVSLDVDVVRREFEMLLRGAEAANERAAQALDQVLRQNFADGDGRLPRTLERFLGDRGQLRGFVTELFDESRRDSAIGRLRTLLGTYFDGDASRLAQLLDPTRLGSPLHQFRAEVSDGFTRLHERLAAIEASAATRASERARSAAKGTDFEATVTELVGDIVRNTGDVLDRTGDSAGDVIRSKKGDLVLTVDPQLSRGAELRVVIECKDRAISGKAMRDELAAARRNRDAAVALVVFGHEHAPAGVAPFDVRLGDVYCVVDPQAPQREVLEAALRLARLLALASLRERAVEVDAGAIAAALSAIRGQLDAIRALKTQLTSMANVSREVSTGLDRLRDAILARVGEAETELRAVAIDRGA